MTPLLTVCFAFDHRVSYLLIHGPSVVYFFVSICFNLALTGIDITHRI